MSKGESERVSENGLASYTVANVWEKLPNETRLYVADQVDVVLRGEKALLAEIDRLERELLSLRTVEEGLEDALDSGAAAIEYRLSFIPLHQEKEQKARAALLRRHAAKLRKVG